MGPLRSDAATQDSTAATAAAPVSQLGVTAANNKSKKRILRNPFHRPRAGTKHNSKSSSKGHRRKVLPAINNDKLCLSLFKGVLPQQLMDELRDQVTSGVDPLAALQATANNKLGKLDNADVQRLFLAAAAASSASCAAVHIAKRLACIVAKHLRLSRPMVFVSDVLMPTGVYGPLLAAYLTVAAAKGAIRQMRAETKGGKIGGSDRDRDRDDGHHQQQQQQQRDWEGEHSRGHYCSEQPGYGGGREDQAGWQQQQQYGGMGGRQYAGDLQQQQQQEEEGEVGRASGFNDQPVNRGGDSIGDENLSFAQDNEPTARDNEDQRRQQQQQHRAPWWAIWKLKQHSRQHQQQQRGGAAAPQAEQLPALTDTPVAARNWNDSSSAAASDSSSGGGGGGGVADLGAEMSRHNGRDLAPAGAAATAAAAEGDDGGVGAASAAEAPVVGASAVPDEEQYQPNPYQAQQQQQQWQQEDGDFAMPLLAHFSSSSPITTPRTLHSGTLDSHTPGDQASPRTPDQGHSASKHHIPISPLPRFLSQITPRSDHSSDLRSDHPDHSGSVSSPTELDSQVDKLQRRWSSAGSSTDHSGLVNENLRLSQLAEPYRPPVFSRLASGRAACRITAAAAAKEEAEERPDHLTVQGSAGSSSSGKIALGRAGSGLPLNPTVLGSEVAKHGGLGAHDPRGFVGLHKAHSDVGQMHPMGPLAAGGAGEGSGPSSSHGGHQQQQQESKQAVGRKVYKNFDWGHRLLASDGCQQS